MIRTATPASVGLALRVVGLFSLGLLVTVTAGCAKPPAPLVKAAPPEVFVEIPVVRSVTDFEDFTGRTEAFKVVDVRPQITALLDRVHFTDGAYVTEGTPLFDLDNRYSKAQLDGAEANLKLSRAKRDLAKTLLATAERSKTSSVISADEYSKTAAEFYAAEAAVKVAEYEVEKAQTTLDYTKISARYTGRLSRRMVDPGNVVKENDTILTRLVVLDSVYVSFDVDERTLLRIRRLVADGRVPTARENPITVKVGLADEEGYSFTAPLTFVDNQLDVGTGTLRFRGQMKNPTLQHIGLPAAVGVAAAVGADNNGPRLLSPGMFVRVRFPVGREHHAVLIPEEAIGADQGQRFVYVLNDKDEAVYRRVVLGAQEGRLRVIDEGVNPGERVVVSGLQRVRGGQKVNPKPAAPGGPTTAGRKSP
ncbi:MAG TPA: efflux RND transporter periplasmic adaptor subunit [Urbifossiella sp.]|jgi:multidrug efflux system membrane fusion protein|nr:efflux RND transporter periplasmic adaptor subunit [Urbifossiella sp.]